MENESDEDHEDSTDYILSSDDEYEAELNLGPAVDTRGTEPRPPGPSPPSSTDQINGRHHRRQITDYISSSDDSEFVTDYNSSSDDSDEVSSGSSVNPPSEILVPMRRRNVRRIPTYFVSDSDTEVDLQLTDEDFSEEELEVVDSDVTAISMATLSPARNNTITLSSDEDHSTLENSVEVEVVLVDPPDAPPLAAQPAALQPPDDPPNLSVAEVEVVSDTNPVAETVTVNTTPFNESVSSNSDDNSLCSICMDPLTNSGDHRVVCLRCGHIFGQSCVIRWIKTGCQNGAKRCPTCNKRANLRDIRILYLPKVVPLDTVERDKLIQEKQQILTEKNMVEKELSKCRLQAELNEKKYKSQIAKIQLELDERRRQLNSFSDGSGLPNLNIVHPMQREATKTSLIHNIVLNKDGGCRVLAYSPLLHQLVVSQPSGNTLFAGFGVRMLNSVDFQPMGYRFLHTKTIRDLACHPDDRHLMLSVSLDQTAKLVDLSSTAIVHTFQGCGPLWSCCWDASNPHLLLTGSQMGKVSQYDRRMTEYCVQTWSTDNNVTPVVALASMPSVAQTPFPQGGFLSCRLNGLFAYARHGNMYDFQDLKRSGPFMSMKYDQANQNLLTSARPSSTCPYVKINLNLVDADEKGNVCLPDIHSFNCGSSAKVLSRVTVVPTAEDSIIIGHNESGRTLNLWSSRTGNLEQSIPIREPAIDLANMCFNNGNCLFASLSERKVCIYKIA